MERTKREKERLYERERERNSPPFFEIARLIDRKIDRLLVRNNEIIIEGKYGRK